MANGLKRVQYRSDFVPPSDCDTVYYAEMDEAVAYMRIAAAILILADDSTLRVGSPIIGYGYISTPKWDDCNEGGYTVDSENGISLDSIKSLILPDETVFLYGDTNDLFSNCTTLEHIELPNNLENIGDNMFSGCTGLTSITIPESVSGIGENAFAECDSLSSITIPDSVIYMAYDVFYDCDNLQYVTIGNGMENISDIGLSSIGSLKSLTIGDSVTCIPDGSLSYLSNLETVSLGSSVTDIAGYAFYGCSSLSSITFSADNVYIGDFVFSNCTSLTSIELPGGMTEINEGLFENCTGLRSIVIPSGVTSVYDTGYPNYGTGPFEGCDNLTNMILGEGMSEIPSHLFDSCTALESVEIPGSITHLGDYAFNSCSNISNIILHEGLLSIDAYNLLPNSYYGVESVGVSLSIPDSVSSITNTFGYSSLADVTVGSGVTSLRDGIFANCPNLTRIVITGNITEIPAYLVGWQDNSSGNPHSPLRDFDVPASVTLINPSAFYYCENLSGITMHEGLLEIGMYAFFGCESLSTITIPSTVSVIGEDCFRACDNLTAIYYTGSATGFPWGANYATLNPT